MRNITAGLFLFFGLLGTNTSIAESKTSLGVGFGALYSGFGVNLGLRGENNFGYIAAGCIGVGYSDNSKWLLPCGIGAGWLWSGLFSKANNRHGLGLYVGPVGVDGGDNGEDDTVVYGVGITYVYFLRGIHSSGWNFGITPAAGQYDGDVKGSLLLNIGFQF